MTAEIITNIITSIIVCIATVISVIIAAIALVQTKKQVELSNKQNLFKDRIKSFLLIKALTKLYINNREEIEGEKEDNIYFNCEFLFYQMINNSYVENMGNVMSNPLHNPEQKEFLKSLEELQNNAEKLRLLFKGEIGVATKKFILAYAQFLMSLYQYKILINSMKDYAKTYPYVDINKAAEDMKEKEHREKLFEAFKEIGETYKVLEKFDIEELVRQIELSNQ